MTGDAVPFLVQVQVNNDVPPMVVRDYAPELDDVRAMLHDICEHVHDSGSVGLLLGRPPPSGCAGRRLVG